MGTTPKPSRKVFYQAKKENAKYKKKLEKLKKKTL